MPAFSTHHIAAEVTDFPAGVEARLVVGGQAFQQVGAVFAIYNPVSSGRRVKVCDLNIAECSARTAVLPTAMTLKRLTACAGGKAIAAVALDSAAAALPAEVLVVREPDSFTTANDTLRNLFAAPQLNATRAQGGYPAWRRAGRACCGGANGVVFQAGDAAVQELVLREGEGIALLTGEAFGAGFPVEVFVHVYDGANYRVVSTVLPLSAHPAPFAIFNGSGSGVVLRVVRFEIAEVRTDDPLRTFSVETISGLAGGDVLASTPADSRAPLSSLVQLRSKCTALLRGPDAGGFGARWPDGQIRSKSLAVGGVGPGLAILSVQALCGIIGRSVFSSSGPLGNEMVLHEGEGLAVLQRGSASGFGSYVLQATLSDEVGGGTLNMTHAEVY